MRIIGCDLHARQQTIAMLDTHALTLIDVVANTADSRRIFPSQPTITLPVEFTSDGKNVAHHHRGCTAQLRSPKSPKVTAVASVPVQQS